MTKDSSYLSYSNAPPSWHGFAIHLFAGLGGVPFRDELRHLGEQPVTGCVAFEDVEQFSHGDGTGRHGVEDAVGIGVAGALREDVIDGALAEIPNGECSSEVG